MAPNFDQFCLVLTCEHASNKMPSFLRGKIPEKILESHRGFDRGALGVAQYLSKRLGVDLHSGKFSRMAIDLNRSVGHPSLMGAWSEEQCQRLLDDVYYPFRSQVEGAIRGGHKAGLTVLHLSVHSFVRILNGDKRNADIGVLYDPKRSAEAGFARDWATELAAHTGLRVRRNYPYRGASDGHTTALRKKFPKRYIGVELEICSDQLEDEPRKLAVTVCDALLKAIRS